MIDYNCPNCGKLMKGFKLNKPQMTLEGLPENEERLMEVVEYFDTGYTLHPICLYVWGCGDCAVKSGTKYSNFVMFKDGYVYGFTGKGWVEIKEKVEFT